MELFHEEVDPPANDNLVHAACDGWHMCRLGKPHLFRVFLGGLTRFFTAAGRSDGYIVAFALIFGVILAANVIFSLVTIASMSRVISDLESS